MSIVQTSRNKGEKRWRQLKEGHPNGNCTNTTEFESQVCKILVAAEMIMRFKEMTDVMSIIIINICTNTVAN